MEISDLFYVIIFLSAIGGTDCILLIFIEKTTRLRLPFSIYLSIVFFLSIPLVIPDTALFFHEPMRAEWFKIIALVWIIGFGISLLLMLVRVFSAHSIIKKYSKCTTERIIAAYDDCSRKAKLKHTPPLLYGKIKEPACVITIWRSYVILQEEIIRDLTDGEIKTILIHELLHVKRKHTIFQRFFDFICCVHWLNPIVWISRYEFLSACEIDCDRSVLKVLDGQLQAIDYAKVMVRLMELSASNKKPLRGTLGALDFWVAKHRISNLLYTPSKLRKAFAVFACVVIVCCTVWLSVDFSRSYFYPFGGTVNGTEWSESK